MIDYEKLQLPDAKHVAELLNDYLPFEEESARTVWQAGGVQLVAKDGHKVIGYIAGYEMNEFAKEFPYFTEQLKEMNQILPHEGTFYTSHFVVHPEYRGQGIGSKLVALYMDYLEHIAKAVVVVGWVKSDTGVWDAKSQFLRFDFPNEQYIERYFEPYDVYCPSCQGSCFCDAHIYYKHII